MFKTFARAVALFVATSLTAATAHASLFHHEHHKNPHYHYQKPHKTGKPHRTKD
jgi:hypothetical protein